MNSKPETPCRAATLVRDHITSHDAPYNYRETLDYFFQDAVAGSTFEGACGQQRSLLYSHYRQLRRFLEELDRLNG